MSSGIWDKWRLLYAQDHSVGHSEIALGKNSSNPSHYGYTYSTERPAPPPEVGWTEKQPDDQGVKLYSENVVQEGETTEAVDRESIANLATTRQQWETIFTSNTAATSPGDSGTLKKKASPKWEVRLPYKEKVPSPHVGENSEAGSSELYVSESQQQQQQQQEQTMPKAMDTESAIEREIRLAHEREEMLRREKEERQRTSLAAEKVQQKGQGQTIIASFEAVSAESESCQPAFNELTEADRGPNLWAMDAGVDKVQESEDESDENGESENQNESIIEREIRLQREREAELARQRQLLSTPMQQQQPQQQKQETQTVAEVPQQMSESSPVVYEDINHNQRKIVAYEDAIANSHHEGESLIARELRELKEREEEMKRMYSSLHDVQLTDEVDAPVAAATPTQQKPTHMGTTTTQRSVQSVASPAQGTWQRDVSPFVSQNRRGSVDSGSSHSTGRTPSEQASSRNVRVQPIADGGEDTEDNRPNFFDKQETPIEREMRIARERENELRRMKGLPEIQVKADDDYYGSFGASPETSSNSSVSRPRTSGQPSNSMKKFASGRLQQELLQQKEREIALRSEGKIISTSEEHIQTLKYMEVTGVDKADASAKRNFVTKKSSALCPAPETEIVPPEVAPSPASTAGKKSLSTGGQFFSYKEFKQTADSKIEKELREMREREEELRNQRSGSQAETPR